MQTENVDYQQTASTQTLNDNSEMMQKRIEELEQQVEEQKLLIKVQQKQIQDQQAYIAKIESSKSNVTNFTITSTSKPTQETSVEEEPKDKKILEV